MKFCRGLGWTLIILAIPVIGWDMAAMARTETYVPVTAGAIWAAVDLASLNLAQAAVQRHILPELWDPVIVTVLLAPLWQVLAVPGVILAWFCRPAHRRRGG